MAKFRFVVLQAAAGDHQTVGLLILGLSIKLLAANPFRTPRSRGRSPPQVHQVSFSVKLGKVANIVLKICFVC
jgi:hypothetical protein